jgi:hypothetical protein
MAKRKPQINFQVGEPLKLLYDEAKISGHYVARFCAAGLLQMVEDPAARLAAMNRLRDWEEEYADATPAEIRAFVQGAAGALQRGARGTPRGRSTPPGKRAAKRG